MALIKAAAWKPVEISSLEPAAEDVVRDLGNGVVVAGPGAGKTELLAQRACFLFQTRACPAPKRILAISFKRDAASNLRKRVKRRCSPEAARRFDSLTFDSFAKSLVDRFLFGLPEAYRPTPEYEIDLELDRAPQIRILLKNVPQELRARANSLIAANAEVMFYRRHVVGKRLTLDTAPTTADEALAVAFWGVALQAAGKSRLTFAMIGRLAELLLRHNPKILAALRATYGYVFLDEFQDTTAIQYDLTCTAFCGSSCRLTAVGDPKQRIMLWAGALDGIFKRFQTDFSAKHHGLAMNYRSAPELVRIQKELIAALDSGATAPKPHRKASDGEGEAHIFSYPNHTTEAAHLAEYLSDLIFNEGVPPSEICILTRTWDEKFSALLIEALEKKGVVARSEKDLQDLLAEPAAAGVVCLLRLASTKRSPQAWSELVDMCTELWGLDESIEMRIIERKVVDAVGKVKALLPLKTISAKSIGDLVDQTLTVLGKGQLKHEYPQYRRGTFLQELMEKLSHQLEQRLSKPMSLEEALDDLEGKNAIPIMTIHKSKGLEYDTVVFVGLEDSTFWNFQKSPEEEKCSFFVAFSRAIQRVVFTFAEYRPRKIGQQPERQSRKAIGSLYQLLEDAGVEVESIDAAH
jgi:DNA helicase II / ATP-dependent DNA helicase PcrA